GRDDRTGLTASARVSPGAPAAAASRPCPFPSRHPACTPPVRQRFGPSLDRLSESGYTLGLRHSYVRPHPVPGAVMYGHGAAPPTRTSGMVITLRVLFVLAGFFSCGLLACLPLFRVAVLRGKWADWLLAWISLPVSIGGLAVIGSVPESD